MILFVWTNTGVKPEIDDLQTGSCGLCSSIA